MQKLQKAEHKLFKTAQGNNNDKITLDHIICLWNIHKLVKKRLLTNTTEI